MTALRPRAAWMMTGLLASAVAASVLTSAPAHAVAGQPVKDGYAYVAKLDIDGRRSCSATLVERQWLITAASCFADDPAKGFKIAPGAPKWKTTATIGRTDLSREDRGAVVDVVELVPREDRDLVMARLARPVDEVSPVRLPDHGLLEGESVEALGYGRTKDEWVPDRLNAADFTVDSVSGGTVRISPKSPDAAICAGDTGGPTLDAWRLVGVHSTSGQAGCFGADASETRRNASETRIDDIVGWIRATASRDVLSRVNWKDAVHVVAGDFSREHGLLAEGTRSDLFVVWADGSASIFDRNDRSDAKRPLFTERKVAPKGSYWKDAEAITDTRVTDGASSGSVADGLTVRWKSGKLSTYTHVDEYGFFEEKTLAFRDSWKNARSITAGRHTANSLRDDLVVLWADGSTSMYSDTGVNGVSKETQLTKADASWTDIAQITSATFTGGATDDLLVRRNDGRTDLFPAFGPSGFRGGTTLSSQGSAWKNAQVMTAGSFGGGYRDDLLVRWADGSLSYYDDVDASGTHKEIQLVG
ncbi:hypothetical protein VR41_07365 [Streptomyces sp. NRRL B-1568]|nr:hypothetical protein VR41_07365 [Streptomyces sp. NRRL B-1568]